MAFIIKFTEVLELSKERFKKSTIKSFNFVGGPPAHSFCCNALPEKMSELNFAGILAGRRFRYSIKEDYVISADADFVIW